MSAVRAKPRFESTVKLAVLEALRIADTSNADDVEEALHGLVHHFCQKHAAGIAL